MPLFILALVTPVVMRVLTALGIGLLTYGAFNLIITNFTDAVVANIGTVPADALAYLTLGGFIDGIGILLGAVAVRVALIAIPRFGRLA